MKRARQFLKRAANLVSGRRQEDRLRAEIEEHIALQTTFVRHVGSRGPLGHGNGGATRTDRKTQEAEMRHDQAHFTP